MQKGDLDNLEKSLYDAMNEVVIEDDRQIWKHEVVKLWADEGSTTFVIKESDATREFDIRRFIEE